MYSAQVHDGSCFLWPVLTGFTHRVGLGFTGPVIFASLFAVNSKVKALRNTDGGKWLAQHVVADAWTSTRTARVRS